MSIIDEDYAKTTGNGDIANRLEALIKANQALACQESLDELLPTLVQLAREVTDSEGASLMIYDPEAEMIKFEVLQNINLPPNSRSHLKKNIELKLGQGIAGWVAQTREPALVNEVQKDSRFFRGADVSSSFTTRNLICAPIIYQEELLGVVSAVNAKGRKGFHQNDLSLLMSFSQLAAVAITRARLLETLLASKRLEVEQANAARIQKLCRPVLPEPVHGSHVWALCEPAGFVGGDTFDLIPMPDRSWVFYVADVTGKGLPAALIVAALTLCFRREVVNNQPVDELLGCIHQGMFDMLEKANLLITMALGRYWPETGEMHLCRAGHTLPLWLREGCQVESPETGCLPLGVFARYESAMLKIRLQRGDSILFYSDGMSEAFDRQGRIFERNGLPAFLSRAHKPPFGPDLARAVHQWQAGTEPSDDLTILEIWRGPKES